MCDKVGMFCTSDHLWTSCGESSGAYAWKTGRSAGGPLAWLRAAAERAAAMGKLAARGWREAGLGALVTGLATAVMLLGSSTWVPPEPMTERSGPAPTFER